LNAIKHGVREIPHDEAKEAVNLLILFVRQNAEFGKFEGSLLALEEELGNDTTNVSRDRQSDRP
jgi:hypothetical protein